MRVGVAASSLVAAVEVPCQVHDPLRARALVVCDSDGIQLVLVALDLLNLENERTRELRRRLAQVFLVAEHRVIVHVTHTHSAPNQHRLNTELLFKAMVAAVRRARLSARPARMAMVQAEVGRAFSRCRRWESRSELGAVTVIDNSGCEFRDGEIYVKGYVQAELARIGHGHVPVPDEARLDGPVDSGISLLHFLDGRGRSIGGIARFAAHPDQVACRGGMVLGAEYPGYLCRRLQRVLGGTFLFLNGPCADLKAYYQGYTWKSCRRTGEGLANQLLAAMPPRKEYRALAKVEVYADNLYLPARRDLARAGIRRGDVVLVHSAIRRCGYVEGGADGLLPGLPCAVGDAGTLVFPTPTGSRTDSPAHPPSFDRLRTPCWTGALAQRALGWPGAVRSFHPTHSCVAVGPMAHALTREHFDSVTPVDAHSPFQKVVQHGGKILIIGLDLKCLTLVHAVEEMIRQPDPCHARLCRCLMVDGDRRELKDYRLHDWSVVAPDYEQYRPTLEKAGAIRALKVGDAASWLLDGSLAFEALQRVMK